MIKRIALNKTGVISYYFLIAVAILMLAYDLSGMFASLNGFHSPAESKKFHMIALLLGAVTFVFYWKNSKKLDQ